MKIESGDKGNLLIGKTKSGGIYHIAVQKYQRGTDYGWK